jgi:hypothetical protein
MGSADLARVAHSPRIADPDTRRRRISDFRHAANALGVNLSSVRVYSPDLNPIEQAFSRLKAALRKGATRTVDALHKLIGKLIKSFAPKMCANQACRIHQMIHIMRKML